MGSIPSAVSAIAVATIAVKLTVLTALPTPSFLLPAPSFSIHSVSHRYQWWICHINRLCYALASWFCQTQFGTIHWLSVSLHLH